jgi:hypothetical protein
MGCGGSKPGDPPLALAEALGPGDGSTEYPSVTGRAGYWTQHGNMDMFFQGDVGILDPKPSLEECKRVVETKGYSAISIGSSHNFRHAALKKFNYHLTVGHCKPSIGFTNDIHIWHAGRNANSYEQGGACETGSCGFMLNKNPEYRKRKHREDWE